MIDWPWIKTRQNREKREALIGILSKTQSDVEAAASEMKKAAEERKALLLKEVLRKGAHNG